MFKRKLKPNKKYSLNKTYVLTDGSRLWEGMVLSTDEHGDLLVKFDSIDKIIACKKLPVKRKDLTLIDGTSPTIIYYSFYNKLKFVLSLVYAYIRMTVNKIPPLIRKLRIFMCGHSVKELQHMIRINTYLRSAYDAGLCVPTRMI